MKKRILSLFFITCIFLSACSLGGGPAPSADGVLGSTSADIDAAGGSIKLKDMTVNIEPGGLGSPVTLTLERIASEPSTDPGVDAQSDTYVLNNLPYDFAGTLNLIFNIPAYVLNAGTAGESDQAGNISLIVGEEAYSRSGGIVTSFSVLPEAQVDLAAKKIYAQINCNQNARGNGTRHLASPVNQPFFQTAFTAVTSTKIYFKINHGLIWDSITHNQYTLYFPENTDVTPIVDAIDLANSKLGELGFTPEPISIYVEDPGNGMLGLFTWGPWRGYQIRVKPSLVTGADEGLNVVIGHELLHYAQMRRYEYKTVSLDSFGSVDDAIAMWFESNLLSDSSYSDQLTNQNIETFLSKPWFSGSELEMRSAGYGASWFIHYMVTTYGTNFIEYTYDPGSDLLTGEDSLQEAVERASGKGMEIVWPEFLEAFVFRSDQVSAALQPASARIETPRSSRNLVKSTIGDNQVEFKLYKADETESGTTVNATAGTLKIPAPPEPASYDPKPKIVYERTLTPWNGYLINLYVDPSMSPYPHGQMEITVSTTASMNSGMTVYAFRSGTRDPETIAGPDDALLINGKSTIVVNDVGWNGSEAKYSQVALILFNAGYEDATMTVTVEFNFNQETTLVGNAIPLFWNFPENTCDFSCCTGYTNPPQCVLDYIGGGGEGDPIPLQCQKNCPEYPEFCYWCSPNNGATILVDMMRESAGRSLSITTDPEGKIINVAFPLFMEKQGEPNITLNPDGSFTVTWLAKDGQDREAIEIRMDGKITEGSGEGTWEVSYIGVGAFFSGTWEVGP